MKKSACSAVICQPSGHEQKHDSINLRHLNSCTIKDAYSLPRIKESLDCLNGACIFTSLDLKSGYWQVEMDEKSIPYTAFTVGPLGFYECIHMPFGLINALPLSRGSWNLVLGNYTFNTVLSIWMTSLFSPKLPKNIYIA